MRRLLIPLLFILLAAACKKPGNNTTYPPQPSGFFLVEIKVSSNASCQLPEFVFLTGQEEAYTILGDRRGTYIGLGFPKVRYAPGTKLSVSIRKPDGSEGTPCTPTASLWTRAVITEVR